ncbi:hypothetical protein [Geosporobacter ferrireducens]|uniref:Uncharacterized protein n=1 Tax=Geosporobacter ferrireducens TaxID=1424294 RepID=A0A1D8GLT8_9FIRM|nr:hypothetical protein [Geosporobacter ferrireducens]AOT71869.1 hypothetical protein Gferi_21420 [Geosporobacter ferrireducens]MTI55654.1 hypothetical protein [Geosporobacter ferrireducens]
MKKFASILIVLTVFSIIMFYPRPLVQIIGEEPIIDSDAHLRVIHRNAIIESGDVVEAYSQKHAKDILDFLQSYKYQRTNVSYRKLDDMESYSVKIINNENEVLRATIRGDRYLSIIDKNGNYSSYKVSRNEFDIEFLQDLYESLRVLSNK